MKARSWMKTLGLAALILAVVGGIVLARMAPAFLSLAFDDVVGVQLARVMDTTVIRELRFVDGDYGEPHVIGPSYAISFEVPESWVYEVRTHINGPMLLFEVLVGDFENRVSEEVAVGIFSVVALASDTYRKELELGDQVWFSGVAAHTDDTHFVWSLTPNHPSSLSPAEFEAIQAEVPAILESVKLTKIP